ncbi:ethanolamine utilization protein eutG [Verticillium alfalfae VaMs.102]|uniref:hydroxyacid-oxoacid transhydrogenase n=1 Tax=Verticillium alfalfae (strain VaMs.102 / ATCC MYA-4576 / FGSC 10136) TaxID=526221 RepID=C9SSQ1_VERA1|nr:ethanolamine utilization protein eutG [Verticillium alfalfae VaMs.102]EEY21816.1 ethanolamine utilization protein eutG [Verticillium alfalfae VaMs.102]
MPPSLRVLPNAAKRATNLLRTIQYTHPPSCPCHSNPNHHHHQKITPRPLRSSPSASSRSYAATAGPLKEYAFEMAASAIRFGPGCTQEVGLDLKNMGAERVAVITDATVDGLVAMQQVRESLDREGINYKVYNQCRVEPKDSSVKEAIAWARPYNPSAFLAVAGTGSETTGTAIFDLVSKRAKTGVAHRNLKPTLGICDPLNTATMPAAVKASSGLDVLCHALESWTAIPYTERTPRPTNPINRPAYQGANPISDVFSFHALQRTVKYLPRAVRNPDDAEAQSEMLLAATLAGVGFGNAGVHLCHGMSYPLSGQNPAKYVHAGYDVPHPLIPHGVSVAVTAPTVFRFTGPSNPERHLAAAEAFGVDVSRVRKEDAGAVLGDALAKFLADLGDQPAGIGALGFKSEDIDGLVEGTLPQRRVLMLAPGLEEDVERERDQLRTLFENAMTH